MTRALAITKRLLVVWGALTILFTLAIGVFFVYQIGPGNRDKIDSASSKDVRFILNWCNLGEDRIERVVHSYVSARSITGDHLDAYAVRITHVSVKELTTSTADAERRWYRGDALPGVLDDAVAFVGGWLNSDEIKWFPKEAELRSSEVYIYPWSTYYHGTRPTATEIIFVRPRDKMVFFFSGKT